jgi:hypothetical protein
LRQLFQDDCGLIKDWGAPLNSSRKDFKNTTQSVDPLTMTIAVDTWDDFPAQDTYPTTLSTPSESGLSSFPISSLPEIQLPTMQFAGLEDNQDFETKKSWVSHHTSAVSSHSGRVSSVDYDDASMEELTAYEEDTAYSPKPFDQEMLLADPRNQSAHQEFNMPDNELTDWELLFNLDPMSVANHQEQVLRSPIYWDSDPGTSDVALN